jgi:hypothetical protein
MRNAAGIALAAAVLVLASAPAGAGTTRPLFGLTATPARISLAGSGLAVVRVANPGRSAVVVDVGRSGFSLDRRGRPRVVRHGGPRAATAWLSVRPRRFVLRAGTSRLLRVTSRLPRRVEPGDHDAVVLLTTRRVRSEAVALRMRLGIVVRVLAPGRVVRRMVIRRLHVRRARRTRVLELLVANRGNVTETVDRRTVHVVLQRASAHAAPRPEARELRPRTGGVIQLPYRGRLRGWVTAHVRITMATGGRVIARTFRIRL